MGIVLIRDDDANATTRPERLARAYAPLFDAGVPVSFSVIPEVALDTRDPDGARERFLDEASADEDRHQALSEGSPLAAWLRESRRVDDVLVHGLSHRRVQGETEFGALDRAAADARIDRARAILERALGARPLGFVAPWDAFSSDALLAATAAFPVVSTGWIDRRRLPLSAWPAFVAERLGRREALRVGGAWLLRHRGCKLTPHTREDEVPAIVDQLTRGADVGVIVLHHWAFWDSGEPHPVIRALARALRSTCAVGLRDVIRHLDARRTKSLYALTRLTAAELRPRP